MKAVSEYLIGNVAVRIVDTGRSIRVINIEKALEKRRFRKTVLAIILTAVLSLTASLSVVDRQSSRISLEKQVYALKSDIESMEQENLTLEKKIEEAERLSYRAVYKRALAMGMDFPKNGQVKKYHVRNGDKKKAPAALMFDKSFFSSR